jgi:hypothetical protein
LIEGSSGSKGKCEHGGVHKSGIIHTGSEDGMKITKHKLVDNTKDRLDGSPGCAWFISA